MLISLLYISICYFFLRFFFLVKSFSLVYVVVVVVCRPTVATVCGE